jgi:hypothetical protein
MPPSTVEQYGRLADVHKRVLACASMTTRRI